MQKVSKKGHMAKLVDALDLGSSGETHQSSSLCMPTKILIFFCAYNNFAIWRLRSGTTQKNRQDVGFFYFDSMTTIAAQ